MPPRSEPGRWPPPVNFRIEYNGLLIRRGFEAEVTRTVVAHLAARPRVGGCRWDPPEIMGAPDPLLPLLDSRGFRPGAIAYAVSARVRCGRAAGPTLTP